MGEERFLLRLGGYHLLFILTIALSLTCNVVLSNGYRTIDSGVLLDLLSYKHDSLNKCGANTVNSEDIDANVQRDKIRKDGDVYKIILEEGETFTHVLMQIGFDKRNAVLMAQSVDKVYRLKKLRAGEELEIRMFDIDSVATFDITHLSRFVLENSHAKVQVIYDRVKNNYHAEIVPAILERRIAYVDGKIANGFFDAARVSGLSRAVVMNLIDILGHQVDFKSDIEFGSNFKVLYEYYVNERGKKVKDGKIKYIFLQTNARDIEVYLHNFSDGTFGYFNKDGTSVKKVLLKAPIRNAVIGSGFGMRKHPVLGYSRMHRGLDYTAPKGTPVIAAGDGVVQIVKSHVNYGRYIKIKHNGKYTTLYAHLNKFANKLSVGSKVKQGDVIGYVGSTGMSTGPHLHYEVHVYGKPVNPAKVTTSPQSFYKLLDSQLIAFMKRQEEIEYMLGNELVLSGVKSEMVS